MSSSPADPTPTPSPSPVPAVAPKGEEAERRMTLKADTFDVVMLGVASFMALTDLALSVGMAAGGSLFWGVVCGLNALMWAGIGGLFLADIADAYLDRPTAAQEAEGDELR